MKNNLAKLDYEIIKRLNQNARLSSNALAQELNVSQKTIKTHLNYLIQNKIIQNVAIVNPEVFGYNNIVDVFIWTNGNEIEDIYSFCKDMNEITYFSKHWENETISIQARFKKFQDLTNFIDALKKIESIQRVEYNIVPEILYDTYSWLPKLEDF